MTTETIDEEDFRVDSNGYHLDVSISLSPGHIITLNNTSRETRPVYLRDSEVVKGTEFSVCCLGSNGEVVCNELYPTNSIILLEEFW